MPFLPPIQQRQSTEGRAQKHSVYKQLYSCYLFAPSWNMLDSVKSLHQTASHTHSTCSVTVRCPSVCLSRRSTAVVKWEGLTCTCSDQWRQHAGRTVYKTIVHKVSSVIRAELKRCMSIERRWNRNEVSRGSPDKEVNWRPTSLKKFRADALTGPNIIIIIIIFWPSVDIFLREFKNWDIQDWVQIYQSVQSGLGKLSCNNYYYYYNLLRHIQAAHKHTNHTNTNS